jgi:hypothetical protein
METGNKLQVLRLAQALKLNLVLSLYQVVLGHGTVAAHRVLRVNKLFIRRVHVHLLQPIQIAAVQKALKTLLLLLVAVQAVVAVVAAVAAAEEIV